MKAQTALVESWNSLPDEQRRLLVRVTPDLETAERLLQSEGIHVRRRCKLVNGFVITCTGAQALLLTQQPWVASIEADFPIYAQSA